MGPPTVTEMSADDAQWAAELMEKRRRAYERYSPVFWRPAEGAVGPHAQYLPRLIAAESTVVLRTAHAFITCARRRSAGRAEGLVDDYAVDPPGA